MPIHLPSLDLLRIFETCARLRSFTSAAGELGSTQPAISQRIQRLERELATPLFKRVHRGIELTEAGAVMLEYVQNALESLREGVESISKQAPRESLTVATDFAFAEYWLLPRLGRFYQQHPEFDVSLVTSNRLLGSLAGDVDAAIVFGDGQIKHGESRLLFREEVFPVCGPDLCAGKGPLGPRDLNTLPLLQLKPSPGQRWYDWKGLFRVWGLGTTPRPLAPEFDNYALLMRAAMAGQGVAIGWRRLVDELLLRGLLRRVFEGSVVSAYGYHLVLPQRKRRLRVTQRFADWLRVELGDDAA